MGGRLVDVGGLGLEIPVKFVIRMARAKASMATE
jgi:hypothetical protein